MSCKLVILVNAVMGIPAKLEDVDCTGITGVGMGDIREARGAGRVYRLLATAERREDGGADLRVAPILMPTRHFLSGLGRKQMGVVYHTDIAGTVTATANAASFDSSAAT